MIIVHILMQIRTPEMGKKALKHTYTKKPVDWKQTRKLLQSSWEILKLGGQANKLLISSHYVQPKLDNLLHFLIECKFCFFGWSLTFPVCFILYVQGTRIYWRENPIYIPELSKCQNFCQLFKYNSRASCKQII